MTTQRSRQVPMTGTDCDQAGVAIATALGPARWRWAAARNAATRRLRSPRRVTQDYVAALDGRSTAVAYQFW